MIFVIIYPIFIAIGIFLLKKIEEAGKPKFKEGDFLVRKSDTPREEFEVLNKEIVILKVGNAKYQYKYFYEYLSGSQLSSATYVAPFDDLECVYEKYN